VSPSRQQRAEELGRLLEGRRRRKARIRKRRQRVLIGLVTLAILIPVGVAVAGFATAEAFLSSCNLDTLKPIKIGQTSFIYAADGSLLGSIPAEKHRQPVPLRNVSFWMQKATVAVEDRRFLTNSGIDYEGIARAFWRDVTAQKVVQGGSTLTQQLVRNLYPVPGGRTLGRKVKEACLAIKLSQKRKKSWILRSWLNNVYFGSSAYGIEAASQIYFSKPAKDLSLKEATLLAGLPQAPSLYDPLLDPKAAIERRDVVAKAMLDTGAINDYQYRTVVRDRSPHLRPGSLYSRIREGYFFNYVIDQLVAAYGANTVREGGLQVYTTIDPRLQRLAEHSIQDTLNEPTDPASALVAIDPRTGAIRAMNAIIPGKKGNQFNLAVQARRQPGSTFKTFVLTTAVAKGINPADSYYVSAPFEYQPSPDVKPWDVSTYDHSYVGWISIEKATLRSDNTVYAQLTLDVGPSNVVQMAHRLGIQSPLAAVPSIGLGTLGVSPLDMASAYATLSAGGVYSRPMAITKVVLPGNREDKASGWGKPARKRVIPEGVAYVVTKILEENVQYGTGTAANFGIPAAGKTGTTDDHADGWFVGYTPTLDAAVWVGYPNGEVPMTDVHGIAVSGGSFPAEIWRQFMEPALGDLPAQDWSQPKTLPTWQHFERGPYALSSVPSYLLPPPPGPPPVQSPSQRPSSKYRPD
jgi:penicillin-binding protein 1A